MIEAGAVAALWVVVELVRRYRKPRWRRLGIPDPADEGWRMDGEGLYHLSGFRIIEYADKARLRAGKVDLVTDAGWYARAIAGKLAWNNTAQRAIRALYSDTEVAVANMIVDEVTEERITAKKDPSWHNRAVVPIHTPADWSVGDEVEVIVRRTAG